MDEISNVDSLRGVLKGKETEHLSDIRKFWNEFYNQHETATLEQIRAWRDVGDVRFKDVFYQGD